MNLSHSTVKNARSRSDGPQYHILRIIKGNFIISQDISSSPADSIEILSSFDAVRIVRVVIHLNRQMNRLVPKIVKGRFFKVSWFGLAGVFSLSKSRVFDHRYQRLAGEIGFSTRIARLDTRLTNCPASL